MEGLAEYYDASGGSDISKHFCYLPFANINKIKFTNITFSIGCKVEKRAVVYRITSYVFIS